MQNFLRGEGGESKNCLVFFLFSKWTKWSSCYSVIINNPHRQTDIRVINSLVYYISFVFEMTLFSLHYPVLTANFSRSTRV